MKTLEQQTVRMPSLCPFGPEDWHLIIINVCRSVSYSRSPLRLLCVADGQGAAGSKPSASTSLIHENDLAVSYSDLDKIFNSDEDELVVRASIWLTELFVEMFTSYSSELWHTIKPVETDMDDLFGLCLCCLHSLDPKELVLVLEPTTSLAVRTIKPRRIPCLA